jgi:hypothetical protein
VQRLPPELLLAQQQNAGEEDGAEFMSAAAAREGLMRDVRQDPEMRRRLMDLLTHLSASMGRAHIEQMFNDDGESAGGAAGRAEADDADEDEETAAAARAALAELAAMEPESDAAAPGGVGGSVTYSDYVFDSDEDNDSERKGGERNGGGGASSGSGS